MAVLVLELEPIDELARQKLSVARLIHTQLAQHLTRNHFDVLVVDTHTLRPIDLLHLVDEIPLDRIATLDAQHLLGILRPLGEQVACLNGLAVLHLQSSRSGHGVLALLALFRGDGDLVPRHLGRTCQAGHDRRVTFTVRDGHGLTDLDPRIVVDDRPVLGRELMFVAVRLARDDFDDAAVLGALQLDDAVELGQNGLALWHTSLEQLLDARQARRDVDTRDATSVEGTHGQLRARLTNGLRGDDTDRVADRYEPTRAHVPAVAVLANAMARLASERRAQVQLRHLTPRGDVVADVLVDQRVALCDNFACGFINHISRQQTSWQLRQAQIAPRRIDQVVDPDALLRAAVLFIDDHVLRDVDQTPRQVAGVSGSNSRVGEALASTVGGQKILEHGQAVAEGRANRQLNDAS